MTTGRINENIIKGMLYLFLFTAVWLKSCTANAQSTRAAFDNDRISKTRLWHERTKKIKTRSYPIYWGAGVAFSSVSSRLESKIGQLNNLNLNFLGASVEGMVGTPVAKLKASGGLFYSGASTPYTIDMYQGAASGSIYLLRLKKVTYHTFEPYITTGVAYQRSQVYGFNLTPESAGQSQNFSVSEAPLAGEYAMTRLNLGAGVEFQLENSENHFIHLFAEATYGMPVGSSASNQYFQGTRSQAAVGISVGASFGIFN